MARLQDLQRAVNVALRQVSWLSLGGSEGPFEGRGRVEGWGSKLWVSGFVFGSRFKLRFVSPQNSGLLSRN